jgi:Na+-driven multidrug efflux pump
VFGLSVWSDDGIFVFKLSFHFIFVQYIFYCIKKKILYRFLFKFNSFPRKFLKEFCSVSGLLSLLQFSRVGFPLLLIFFIISMHV